MDSPSLENMTLDEYIEIQHTSKRANHQLTRQTEMDEGQAGPSTSPQMASFKFVTVSPLSSNGRVSFSSIQDTDKASSTSNKRRHPRIEIANIDERGVGPNVEFDASSIRQIESRDRPRFGGYNHFQRRPFNKLNGFQGRNFNYGQRFQHSLNHNCWTNQNRNFADQGGAFCGQLKRSASNASLASRVNGFGDNSWNNDASPFHHARRSRSRSRGPSEGHFNRSRSRSLSRGTPDGHFDRSRSRSRSRARTYSCDNITILRRRDQILDLGIQMDIMKMKEKSGGRFIALHCGEDCRPTVHTTGMLLHDRFASYYVDN